MIIATPAPIAMVCSRIRALIGRTNPGLASTLQVGDLVCNPTKHQVTKAGVEIHLGPRDFALLEFLMRNTDCVFSGEALIERVWHSETEATPEAIKASVKRLRHKLDSDNADSIIETIPKIGYRLRSH